MKVVESMSREFLEGGFGVVFLVQSEHLVGARQGVEVEMKKWRQQGQG